MLAAGCMPGFMSSESSWTCQIELLDRKSRPAAVAECPCTGTGVLHRDPAGGDATLLQYSIQHCPHPVVAERIPLHLEFLIPEQHHDRLRRDFDAPARDQHRDDVHRVEAVHVYGDRTIELDWSRDAHRGEDGKIAVQDRETYFIAVRPRKPGDRERVTVHTEPLVTAAPNIEALHRQLRCPL